MNSFPWCPADEKDPGLPDLYYHIAPPSLPPEGVPPPPQPENMAWGWEPWLLPDRDPGEHGTGELPALSRASVSSHVKWKHQQPRSEV